MQTKDYYFNSFYGWWKNIDKLILIIVLTLLFLGLFFSLVSTSLIASNKLETNSYYFLFRIRLVLDEFVYKFFNY